MVFSLAPNAISNSSFQTSSTAVSSTEMTSCATKQLPKVRSADSLSPLPIKMDARGAPPLPTSAANADTIIMSGRQTPTPVSAAAPMSGMCPM